MKNKKYLKLYIFSIQITIANIFQTGYAISTGNFAEANPLGYNWFRILLIFLIYLSLSMVFFIDTKSYKCAFLIGIIWSTILGFICFTHDFIVINII